MLGNTIYAAAIMMFGADFLWAIVLFVCFFLFPMSSHQVSTASVCQDGLCSESRNLSTWPYDYEHQELQCFGVRWRRSRDDENFELCSVKEGRKERGNKRSCCCCWRKRSRTGSRNKQASKNFVDPRVSNGGCREDQSSRRRNLAARDGWWEEKKA